MARSIRYIFLIDLESIQHKLSSDYSLNIYFSQCFPYIDGPSFSPYKPLQNVDFSKVSNMQFFFQELYSHIDKNLGSPGDEATFFFIHLTHLVESWDLNFLKLLYLGSLNQRDVLKNMSQIYI